MLFLSLGVVIGHMLTEYGSTMKIALFEDQIVSRLAPITQSKPAYAIGCGGSRLLDLACDVQSPVYGLVRPYLHQTQTIRFAVRPVVELPSNGQTLWINARLAPCQAVREMLGRVIAGNGSCVVWSEGQLAAARLPAVASFSLDRLSCENLDAYFSAAGLDTIPSFTCSLPLINYPHDVISFHKKYLAENLMQRIQAGPYREISDGLFAASGATVGQYVVTDTAAGPIVLEEGANIGAHSYVQGPVHVGREARLIEFSCVKDAVAVGDMAKIGGEVIGSVVEPYSNKQHHGYLGNSYVGSWVNLGAGTSNSDLKNTYGEIRMEYDGDRIGTGSQFMGCVIGDYVKSAVNTSIFTGKIVGVCSMLYGFITMNVPGFVNYAQTLGYVTEVPLDVAVTAQQRVFRRRNVPHRPHDVELIHELFELTRAERETAAATLACYDLPL